MNIIMQTPSTRNKNTVLRVKLIDLIITTSALLQQINHLSFDTSGIGTSVSKTRLKNIIISFFVDSCSLVQGFILAMPIYLYTCAVAQLILFLNSRKQLAFTSLSVSNMIDNEVSTDSCR